MADGLRAPGAARARGRRTATAGETVGQGRAREAGASWLSLLSRRPLADPWVGSMVSRCRPA
ncbi:hypothetical protein ABT112_00020 [Streptomyces sp. NPDC002055]|uniref:hypothetical protein n=1 Tax=Streptomyces sp. NPDC002055 TaxID=3154534 RepID=UPI003321FF3C